MYDSTYILVIIGALICLAAQAKVKNTYARYSKVRNMRAMTGREAAEKILHDAGIYDVSVQHISGEMTDYYDPKNRKVCLSDGTYNSTSVAAMGIAAHECGHAIQHHKGYAFLSIRSALVPVVNFTSAISWPLILIGFLFNGRSSYMFLSAGILLFAFSVLFQIVTLPVEFNASSRAIHILRDTRMLGEDEVQGTKKVLQAAALTYVASVAAVILQLLRLILIANNRGGRRGR
jgi:hypothetical protein